MSVIETIIDIPVEHEHTVRRAKNVFSNLIELSKSGNDITEQNVDYAISLSYTESDDKILDIDKVLIRQ